MGKFTGKFSRRETGTHTHWLFWEIPLWRYTNSPYSPLTYTLGDGTKLTPDRHMLISDGMSSPPLVWGIHGLAQTDFPASVYFHDTANKYGGLYFNNKFKLINYRESNSLLHEMVLAEGGSQSEAAIIYAGVSLGMPFIWNPAKQKQSRLVDGVVITA